MPQELKEKYLNSIFESIVEIKGPVEIGPEKRIVTDLNFESIDVIDLFFEIQKRTSVEIDINEIAIAIGGTEGRRFNDIKISDILEYLLHKSQ